MQDHRILILFAHPSVHRSKVNKPLVQIAETFPGVTVVDLYAKYPTYLIDIEAEQQALRDHNVIIFMFPLYWYSTPAMLKEWQELVLEYGFAYGKNGAALQDKLFFCVTSAGGAEQAYQGEDPNFYSLQQLLQPLEQMAKITQMNYLPPFVLFGARTAADEGRLSSHKNLWKSVLSALLKRRINPNQARRHQSLNQYMLSMDASSGERS